jgi:nucleoside-diphosphate-sugar epimerase
MNAVQAIVFGGAGFIGSHLCDVLAASGKVERIVVADVVEPDTPHPDVTYRHVDVRAPIPTDLAEPDAPVVVYNLAAVHRTPGHPDHEYYETNVLGAVNVCDFARAVGCEEIVFTSSIAVYGAGEERKSEDSRPTPDSAYGWSKLLAESIHRSWRREASERQLTISRPAVIFGPGENGNFTRLARSIERGLFWYPGRRDTVKGCGYVGELVQAMLFVQDQGEPEITFNFCYRDDYTIEDICHAFERVAGRKAVRGTIPSWLMMTAAAVFEFLDKIGLENDINRARILKLTRSTNIEPATLKSLDYVYETDLEEALSRWRAAGDGDKPAFV